MSSERDLPKLPLAFEYIYEFTGGIGGIHRKMSPARWNGNEVSKSYLVYTADQMREYARAAIAVQPPAASQPSDKPYAYAINIPAEQRIELVHDLEDAIDELTNCECEVIPLYDHPVALQTPAASQPSAQPPAGEVAKDAARWRWLREQCQKHDGVTIAKVGGWDGLEGWSGDDPDAEVDAAMSALPVLPTKE